MKMMKLIYKKTILWLFKAVYNYKIIKQDKLIHG